MTWSGLGLMPAISKAPYIISIVLGEVNGSRNFNVAVVVPCDPVAQVLVPEKLCFRVRESNLGVCMCLLYHFCTNR